MRALRLFLVSFLVLFLQVALIRWMPAYVRLLAYFSNFILLAAFLGIGVGCLMTRTRSLFAWYAPLQALVIGVVAYFRLEVAVPTSTSIYFSSGTTAPVVVVESTMLLPLVFVVVAVLFATLAQTMGKLLEGLPPLKGYGVNLAGSIAGVVAFGLMSWFELPPTAWFAVAFAVAVLLVDAPMGLVGRLAMIVLLGGSLVVVHGLSRQHHLVAVLQDHHHPGRAGDRRRGQQHLPPVDGPGGAQGVLLPVAVHGLRRRLRGRADPRRRLRHRRRGVAPARQQAHRRGGDRSGHRAARARAPSRPALRRSPRQRRHRRCAALPAHHAEEVRPRGVRADRLADPPIELHVGAARELHVHGGVVPRRQGPPQAGRRAGHLQLLPRAVAGRSAGQHRGHRVRHRAARPHPQGAQLPRRADGRPRPGPDQPDAGAARSRRGLQPPRRHQPGRAAGARCRRGAGDRRLAVPLHAGPAHPVALPVGAGAGPGGVGGGGPRRALGHVGRLLVALLLPRRRLHAARDQVDHPVRAVVGLDLGGGVARHPLGAGDGDGGDVDRQPDRGDPAVARRRRPAGAPGRELRPAGRPAGLRQPRPRVGRLRGS